MTCRPETRKIFQGVASRHEPPEPSAFDEVRTFGRQRPGRLSILKDTETPNGAVACPVGHGS